MADILNDGINVLKSSGSRPHFNPDPDQAENRPVQIFLRRDWHFRQEPYVENILAAIGDLIMESDLSLNAYSERSYQEDWYKDLVQDKAIGGDSLLDKKSPCGVVAGQQGDAAYFYVWSKDLEEVYRRMEAAGMPANLDTGY